MVVVVVVLVAMVLAGLALYVVQLAIKARRKS